MKSKQNGSMPRVVSNALVLAAALGMALCPAPDTRAQIKAPRLNYRERSLANGLRIFSLQDKSSPTVSIQVWYKVGSKDDPEGRSGFAHLFEHMMFKRTKNMKAEMFDRLTEDIGGFNNASTWDDYTDYYEVVPSHYLETLLWAEADRMGSLIVDDEVFKSERDVVKEEYRERILAPPYGRFFYLIQQRSFSKHPYRRPGIGSLEDLDAATGDDVRAFHSTFYRPDNATLIVAGDFDQAQLDGWIDKYFARIEKPNRPLPRVAVKEPDVTKPSRFEDHFPNVPLPAVALSFPSPPASHEDSAALAVADAILSAGESSRLYQSLVYRKQLAAQVFTLTPATEDPGFFAVAAIVAGGKKADDVERALTVELESMREKPVTAEEMERAKNQLITTQLRQRETSHGKAQAIGLAAVLLGDASRVNTDLERLQAVTAADVQRVMKKYFAGDRARVFHYLPEASAAAHD